MPDPSLYLFDGYNVLHAGPFADERELVDRLASFVAIRGARGVVVFDGAGADRSVGSLDVRYAAHADEVLERLAADHRTRERVCLVSSDSALRRTSGQEVEKLASNTFARELAEPRHDEPRRSPLGDRLDAATQARLERMRRGES
ncbi:MAG: NYN domain-containing protein [Actinomycetota bacterium]|nr:NYN domain-containing protein [Actinomycetota bacterium]